MTTDVVIPHALWEEDESAVISVWLFDDGDTVQQGDVLAEIMVAKVTYDLLSPGDGKLVRLVEAEEASVVRGDKVAEIR